MTNWHRVARVLTVSWSQLTAILLLVIAFGVLTQPAFPLGLGVIRTTGLSGLWVTLVPAVAALAGVALLRRRIRVGAGLLGAYSLFWTTVVASWLPAGNGEADVVSCAPRQTWSSLSDSFDPMGRWYQAGWSRVLPGRSARL